MKAVKPEARAVNCVMESERIVSTLLSIDAELSQIRLFCLYGSTTYAAGWRLALSR